MNENTQYEKFTREIYQTLIDAQGIETIDVKHNLKIEGKSGQKHQIDVYWEYKIAGILHKVAIECKNYNSQIRIGTVRNFHSVLLDIGNIQGIIVSKSGFQRGSKEFAEHYGITLKELREPQDEDWKGRLRKLVINSKLVMADVRRQYIQVDEEWVKKNIELPKDGDFSYSISGMSDEIWIFDDEGNKLKNFYQLQEELPLDSELKDELEHSYNFDNGFVLTDKFGMLKVKSIKFWYKINSITDEFVIDGKDFAKAILKDALTEEIKFINKDNSVK